jgi:hypothetical protein
MSKGVKSFSEADKRAAIKLLEGWHSSKEKKALGHE